MIKINNFPNYTIDRMGNVYLKDGRIKAYSKDKKGYCHISLSHNGKKGYFLIHRLVAIHFVPNPLNLPEINHLDGNKQNNNDWNLEWVDGKTNINHSFINGMSNYQGERNGRCKLNNLKVVLIKKLLLKDNIKLKDIANMFSVHPNTISEIKRGVKWKHIVL